MKEKILEILTEINEDIAGYEGDGLLEDGIIASLDVIEIVSALEDEFGIIIAAKRCKILLYPAIGAKSNVR